MNKADEFLKKYFFGHWIFLCLFLVNLKLGAPATAPITRRSLFSEPTSEIPGPKKNYTGIRVKSDSILLLYYHEQTLAIVESDEDRILHNCELLEVRTKVDQKVTLNRLKAVIPTQIRIAFDDMLDLMNQCNKLDPPSNYESRMLARGIEVKEARQLASIFSGLFPGTKWCGAGDVAASYHDLGTELEVDKCCRQHDLCPVKISGFKTEYNLTNYGIYTRSHCKCDNNFYNCLKAVGTTASNTLGRIYFNVAPVVCIEDAEGKKKQFKTKEERF